MSSTSSVGEFGWIRAERYPFAPTCEPGSGFQTLLPTVVSSSFERSFTTQATTSLERPRETPFSSSCGADRMKRFRSPSVQEAVRAVEAVEAVEAVSRAARVRP